MLLKVLKIIYHQNGSITKELFRQKFVIKRYSRAVILKVGTGELTCCLEEVGSPYIQS